jgi:EmrB/QacA subfamily drug resistance transporter
MTDMSATVPAPTPSRADRRQWLALVVVCLAQLMNVLDSTIVNVALPKIQHDLHFTQSNLAWVLDAYLISFGSFLLLAGRLGDLVGRKKVFLTGVVIFTAASAVCGIAESQAVLIVARFIQGFGGALCSSVVLAIITTEFRHPADRAKAMSSYILVIVSGGSLGLIAGGVITQLLNWHWNFYINVPIGIAAFVLGWRLIEENEGIGLRQGVDVLGAFLVTAGVMVGVYAIVTSPQYGWGSLHTLGLLGVALVTLAAFFALESRIENPMVPLRILRIRTLIGSSVVRGFLITGMFASFFLGALYLQRVRDYTALETGLAFLPMTAVTATMSRGLTSRLTARLGELRMVLGGLALIAISMVLMAFADATTPYAPLLLIAYITLGVGAGGAMAPLLTMALADVPSQDAGLGSGIVNVSLQLAAALGVAVLGTIATERTKSVLAGGHTAVNAALVDGYRLAFAAGGVAVVVGIVIAAAILRRPRAAEPAVALEREPA